MRFSLTGSQVGCTTYTSAPRTLSSMETPISPSENRKSLQAARGTPRFMQMLSANWGWELPENTLISLNPADMIHTLPCLPHESALASSGCSAAAPSPPPGLPKERPG